MGQMTLEERIARLEAIEAAKGFFYTYAETLDAPDPEAVAALFVEAGELKTPIGDFAGREAIKNFYAEAFAADTSLKRHFLANPRAEVLADGNVRVESYFLYVGRGDGSIIGWGTYDDVVSVADGDVRYVSKKIEIHMGTTLSEGWAL